MAQLKSSLQANKIWSENRRYSVGNVVSYLGSNYQNITGVNSIPTDAINWNPLTVISSGSGIIDAPAIPGTGTTIMTFDEIRYHALTAQTGNIALTLNATPNINKNGRVQVYDINGATPFTFTHPANSVNSNGVAFDNTKNNVIYYDNVNGKLKYNITLQNLPDVVAPTYLTQNISNITSNSAKFNATINEGGFIKWYLSPSNTPPTKANILSGTGAVGANFGSITANASVPLSVNLTGLSVSVGYHLFSYAEDTVGNQTAIQSVLTFSTVLNALASDDFNSANVTDITNRITPVGLYSWAKGGAGTGSIGIVNNSLKNTGIVANLDNIYIIPIGFRNIDLSVTFKAVGTIGSTNIEFARSTDSERYYLRSDMQLRKVVAGSNQIVATIAGGLANGDVVRIVLNNTTISVFKNGVQVYTGASDPAVTGTSVGIYMYQDNVVDIDNLIIY